METVGQIHRISLLQFRHDFAAGDDRPQRRVLQQTGTDVHAGPDECHPAPHRRSDETDDHIANRDAHARGDPGSVAAADVASALGEPPADHQCRADGVLDRCEVDERAVSLEVLDRAGVGGRGLRDVGSRIGSPLPRPTTRAASVTPIQAPIDPVSLGIGTVFGEELPHVELRLFLAVIAGRELGNRLGRDHVEHDL